ncbi:type II toxin-antitoxin system PemK/MazF family toxin [Tessaracoccus sp.]|uniref:type II toxin-antitoxin system PemK/MazF family toxin n=1 Tax=Tessaracoccus sp. TaxID=1971211 RepID=UPI0026084D82|nr:type II toxin-antitoxin system PemK/MazF family toxin [Tessaracoccus sp.]
MANSNGFLDGVLTVLREVAERALDRATRQQRRSTRKSAPKRESAPKPKARTKASPQPRTTAKPKPPASARTAATPKTSSANRPQPSTQTGRPLLYPGDYTQRPTIVYQPRHDAEADPGEIVWTWVPYEEDHAEGKDRPVLLIGRDGPWLLGLQVTSQDHDRDAAQEARAGRYWLDIGAGAWDPQRRPSEVRVNRIVRIDPGGVRRIGAVLDERVFAAVATEVRRHY